MSSSSHQRGLTSRAGDAFDARSSPESESEVEVEVEPDARGIGSTLPSSSDDFDESTRRFEAAPPVSVELQASPYRHLPSIRELLDDPSVQSLLNSYSRDAVVQAVRSAVARVRGQISADAGDGRLSVGAEEIEAELQAILSPRLVPVINATGTILHTNLGRSPLSSHALERMTAVARGYCNLELRLKSGTRGGRNDPVDEHVQALTGAERAFAVNNGAAAALLMLASSAAGREVIVSRGELVEIGGGFRIPEVLEQSGCQLVEVGTTNRTRITDYERAISPNTGALLKVNPSNFAIVGFTKDASLAQLGELARQKRIPLLFDEGSGDLESIKEAVEAGVDLVSFSGDKLLGGPQAGILAGRSRAISKARSHPLARALRLGKLGLAALEATLALRRAGRAGEIPIDRMLNEAVESVRLRAQSVGELLGRACEWSVVPVESLPGGGALPSETLPSFALRIEAKAPHHLADALRTGEPAVLGRVEKGALLLDARTFSEGEVPGLVRAVLQACERPAA